MKLSLDDEELLLKAMKASDESLLQVLGQEASKAMPNVAPPDTATLIEMGQQRLKLIFTRFRDQLCSGSLRETLNKIDDSDDRKAILAILDIILAQYGILPAVCTSILLSRGLLKKWCKESGTPDV